MLSSPHSSDAATSDHRSTCAIRPFPTDTCDDTYGSQVGPETTQKILASIPQKQEVQEPLAAHHIPRDRGPKQQRQQHIIHDRHADPASPPQMLDPRVKEEHCLYVVKDCACFSRGVLEVQPEREHEESYPAYSPEGDGRAGLCAGWHAAAEETAIASCEHSTRRSFAAKQRASEERATRKLFVPFGRGWYDKDGKIPASFDGGADANQTSRPGPRKKEVERKDSGKVKERIRAIEQKGSAPTNSGLPLRSVKSHGNVGDTDGPGLDEDTMGHNRGSVTGVPLVFPLHVRKFHRRRSNGSPLRPETPLYRSDPGQETDIQSPLPQRSIPIVRAPSEASIVSQNPPATTSTPVLSPEPERPLEAGVSGGKKKGRQHPLESRHPIQGASRATQDDFEGLRSPQSTHHHKHSAFQSQALANPFVHFHGTRSSCVRHGRKSGLLKPKSSGRKATKEMFERSRSEANKDGEDACPDYVAELGIKRRDMERAVSEWSDTAFPDVKVSGALPATTAVKPTGDKEPFPAFAPSRQSTLTVGDRPLRQESWMSTTVEPPDSESEDESQTASTAPVDSAGLMRMEEVDFAEPIPAQTRKPSRSVHFQSLASEYEQTESPRLIISRDLGDDLDAVILERGGRVERVVTNTRDGNPTPELLDKLSRELAEISKALSTDGFRMRNSWNLGENEMGGATGVVDGHSDIVSSRRSSVPELLQLINDAAIELEPGLIRKPTWERVPGGHAWLDQVSANDFAAAFEQSFQPFDEPQTRSEADQMPITSANDRLVSRQRLDEDYQSLKDHLFANTHHGKDLSLHNHERLRDHERLQDRSSTPLTTSTRYASRPSSSPTQHLDPPDPTSRVAAGEATLPSHVLRAQDFISSPSPQPLGSPLIPNIRLQSSSPSFFTPSTAPSLTASAANSAQTSPQERSHKRQTPLMQDVVLKLPVEKYQDTKKLRSPMEKLWGSPSEVKANSQAIRHVMRMEKMSAVQEAAAVERAARRARMGEKS